MGKAVEVAEQVTAYQQSVTERLRQAELAQTEARARAEEESKTRVEAEAASVFPIARGLRTWRDAIADGSVAVFGDPGLARALPRWFGEPAGAPTARRTHVVVRAA